MRDCLAKHPDDRPASASELIKRYEVALGKRFPLPRRSCVVPNVRAVLEARAASGPSTPLPTKLGKGEAAPPLRTTADQHSVQHSIEACMPESMAMLKLKGFIHDLGGEVVESVPGMIRVRLPDRGEKKGALFGWFDRRPAVQVAHRLPPTSSCT